MIRERFDIDNMLILEFLKNNNFNNYVERNLIKWYAILGEKDYEQGREQAISVIQEIASESLMEISFPEPEKKKLIDVFNPLESILRTAYSLKKNNIKVRDHLSHTIRNILFSNYILQFYDNENDTHLSRQLLISAIFHDIGYPIEKLKKIGDNLKDSTFRDLLNSSGEIHFNLDNPDDLLEIMDFFGNLSNDDSVSQNTTDRVRIQNKIRHIYQKIIVPAIAGRGLFNSHHSISSVVLFLRPILKHWRESNTYLQMRIESICDICLSIAYHDRSMNIDNFKEYDTKIPLIVKVLRIADELQEWDRVRKDKSFIQDAIIDSTANHFTLNLTMKDNEDMPCSVYKFLPDKVLGIAPVIGDEYLTINLIFPNSVSKKDIIDPNKYEFKKENTSLSYFKSIRKFSGSQSKHIKLIFHKNKVEIILL